MHSIVILCSVKWLALLALTLGDVYINEADLVSLCPPLGLLRGPGYDFTILLDNILFLRLR